MEINEDLILGLDDNSDNPVDYKGSVKRKKQEELLAEQTMLNNIARANRNIGFSQSVADLAPVNSYWEEGERMSDLLKGQNEYLANQQGYISKFVNSLGQGVGTFGTSVASTLGTLASLPYAAINEAVTEGDQDTMSDILNNPLMRSINELDKYIKQDLLPTYYTEEQKNSLLSAATGTDLINGVGFLLSNIVPGGIVAKGFGSLGKLASQAKLGKLAGSLDEMVAAGKITTNEAVKIANIAKPFEKMGEVTGALVGRLGESAMEAYGTYEQLINSGTDEETAKRMRDNVFFGNMALGASDFLQATRWLNKGGIADDIIKEAGKFAVKPKTFSNRITSLLGEGAQEAAEEGVQFLLQKGAEKGAKDGDFFKGLVESTGDLFTTIEGQKSMLLGAVLGGGASTAFAAMNKQQKNEFLNNTVNELNSNPTFKDRYIINAEGQRVLNPEFVNSTNAFTFYEKQKEQAKLDNDKEAYDLAEKLQFSNLVASRKKADMLDDFMDELQTLGRANPSEIKAMFGEMPKNEFGEEMTPSEISRKYINEAKQISKMIDGINIIPQFTNLSTQAKDVISQTLIHQDSLLKSYKDLQKNVNELSLSENPLDLSRAETLRDKADVIEKEYKKNVDLLNSFLAKPEIVEKKAEEKVNQEIKKQEDTVEQQVKDFNFESEANEELVNQIETDATKTNTPIQDYEILLPNGETVSIITNPLDNSTTFQNSEGKDITKNFHSNNPNFELVKKGTGVINKLKTIDVDLNDSEEAPEGTVDETKGYKKTNVFTSSGRSSMSAKEFNVEGDRRDLNIPVGRKLYFDKLAIFSNENLPLSLKLETVPEGFEGFVPEQPLSEPIIAAYLYSNGKPITENGVAAYTVLNDSNNKQLEVSPEDRVKLKNLKSEVISRQNQGLDSYVTIDSISPGFLNLMKDLMENPLSTLKDVPAVTAGGMKIAVSMMDINTGIPIIEHNGQKVNVKFSGRPYLAVKTGIVNGKPVYVYHELQTRNLSAFEVDNVMIPLIKEYLEGKRVKKVSGKEVSILSYDPEIYSVLDMFGYFGQSSNIATSMKFEKEGDVDVLYFGKDASGKVKNFITSENFDAAVPLLRSFLLSKKRTVSNKHLNNFLGERNIPVLKDGSWSMVNTTYEKLMTSGVPSAFPPAVYHNISTLDNNIFLNKYATFNPKIEEKPNTRIKTSLQPTVREQPAAPKNEPKQVIPAGKISIFAAFNLSLEEQQKLDPKNIVFAPKHLQKVADTYETYKFTTKNPESVEDFTKRLYPSLYEEVKALANNQPVFAQQPKIVEEVIEVKAPEIVVESIVETQPEIIEEVKLTPIKTTNRPRPSRKKPLPRKVSALPYKKGDVEAAKKWIEVKLGVTPEISEGMLKLAGYEGSFFGYFYKGAITLSDILEEGTEYHESFHLVSQMYLNASERKDLYNEVRKTVNKEYSDLEAEEYLAEKFRDFVMSDGKLKFPEAQQNAFQKLWNFIKSLLGLSRTTVNDVFDKINEGYYNKASYINRLGEGNSNLALFSTFETTPYEVRKINQNLLTLFRGFIVEKNQSFANFEIEDNLSEFNKYAKEQMSNFPSAFNVSPDEFLDTFKSKILTDLGFEFEEDEDSSDNNSRNKNEQFVESNKISSFAKISRKIEFLLNTIVNNAGEVTEFNQPPLIPASEVKAFLANQLHDTFTFEEMVNKLQSIIDSAEDGFESEFQEKSWDIATQILDSLGPMSSDNNTVFLQTQFFDALSLSYQTMLTQIYFANKDNLSVSVIDSMKQSIKQTIRERWTSNLMATDYVENIDGQRIIRDFAPLFNMPALEFAKAVGLNFNSVIDKNVINLINNFKVAINNLPKKPVIINGLTEMVTTPFWYTNSIEDALVSKDKKVNQNINIWRKALKALEDVEIENTSAVTENQSRNSENERVYAFVKPSFLFQRIAAIKKGLDKYISVKNSKLWDAIADNKVEIALPDGQNFSEQGEVAQHISTLTEEELLVHKINGMFGKNNKYPTVQFLQMADKKSVYGLVIKDKSLIYKPDEITVNDGYLEVPNSFIDRMYDIYLNYKEFDKLKLSNKYQISSAAKIFDDLGDITNKSSFDTAIKKNLYEAYLDAKSLADNFNGKDRNGNIRNVLGDLVTETNTVDKIIGALVTTEMVTNLEQMNIFFGNPAFYKDLFKRTPAIRANGRIPSIDSNVNDYIVDSRKKYYGDKQDNLPSDPTKFKAFVFSDPEVESFYHEQYKKELGVDAYNKVNPSDAQGIITFPFYREYMIRTGQWNKILENQFEAEINNKPMEDAAWPPLKLVHFGAEANNTEYIPVYYKFSVYPLVPSLVKGRKLETIVDNMLNSGTSIGVAYSGNKVGQIKDTKENSNIFSEISSNHTHTLNIQDLKIQVDISAKNDKWEQLFGTQLRKLIIQNAVDAGENFKNKEDYDKFLNTVVNLANIELNNLAESLDTTSENLKEGELSQESWRKLIDLFKESAIEREESDNIIFGLDYLKDQTLTIDALPTRDKIQNLMNALINNRILKQKMFGRSYVQASSVGFEYKDEKALKRAVANGEVLTDSEFYKSHFVNGVFNNDNARLGFIHKVEDEIKIAEILLPYWFKNKVKIDDLNPKLLETLAYRIPTQGLNSISAFKVVGFLPKSSDQIAAVPYEITMQAGSDFDVDKLNVFLRNYVSVENKPQILSANADIKKLNQDKLLDLMIKRLKDPERFEDYITPNSADNLQKQAEEINNLQQPKYKLNVDYKGIKQFWSSTNIKVGKNFWSAKAGVGQAASHSVFTALTQISPLVMKEYSDRLYVPDANYNENGNLILGKKLNVNNKPIIDLIGNQHLSANVDAAKNPFIFKLNANARTNDLHYLLLEFGVDDKWVNAFMTQPIILEYIKKMAENRGLVSKFRKKILSKTSNKNTVIEEVRAMFGGENVPSEYLTSKKDAQGKTIPTSLPEGRVYSTEELLDFIKKPKNQSQLNILDDFLFYNEWAMDLRNVIGSLKFDTQGAGKNLPESMIYNYKYKKLNQSIFDGVYALVDNTIIKPFKENVLDVAINMYTPTVAVNKISNSAQALFDIMNILYINNELKPENLYKVYGMLTNIIIQNNLPNKQEWFANNISNPNGIVKKMSKLMKSGEMKGNYLFDHLLTINFAQKQGDVDVIKFDNTVRINTDLEAVITQSFKEFKSKYPELYKDLIKMSLFQTGVITSPISFYKYIPVDDFVDVVKDLIKMSYVTTENMKDKVVQNLPTLKGLARTISKGSIIDGKNGLPDAILVPFFDPYITKFDYKEGLGLYKFKDMTDEGNIYTKLPILGNYNLYNGISNNEQEVNVQEEELEENLEFEDAVIVENLMLSESTLTWDSLSENDKFALSRAGISPEEFNDMPQKEKEMTIECYGIKK